MQNIETHTTKKENISVSIIGKTCWLFYSQNKGNKRCRRTSKVLNVDYCTVVKCGLFYFQNKVKRRFYVQIAGGGDSIPGA